MSALAMILTVAMVVSGDGSEKVSGEAVQELNLNGEWEGESQNSKGRPIEKIKISRGRLCIEVQGRKISESPLKIIKEGDGILRWETIAAGQVRNCLGIYKWQENRLLICLRWKGEGRPTSFATDDTNCLLIFRRVNARK